MFYETAQTVGPGWHRSYKPSHYEDMNWQPSSKNIRSPGSSPETYRRIIRNGEDFPSRTKEQEDEFFNSRRSPTFPRRIFKEVWNDSSPTHRFSDRPRMFKRVFRPDRWEDEFDHDIPHLRRVEREFDRDFDDGGPTRKFDKEFEKRFSNPREFKKTVEDDFEKSDGKVHHIPILVEKRMDEMKSRFGKNDKSSPPPEKNNQEEYSDEWVGPQVQRLKKSFEQPDDSFSPRYRVPKIDTNSKPRPFMSPNIESWDPHAIHTLPTRKAHKSSQSFDDSRHPVPPKSVYRSYSETHEESPRQSQQQQHSAAFRSHSDGHCPEQTYVTRIKVNLPSQKEKDEQCSPGNQSNKSFGATSPESSDHIMKDQTFKQSEESIPKGKGRNKYDNPSMQQIAVVLQNVEDLVLRVEAYNGVGRDKQYRFLDEMLTRCMLRLDDVDTEGREDIRMARKAALREVQNCIDRLEAKADESERRMQQNAAKDAEDKKNDSENQAIPSSEVEENDLKQNKAIPLPAKPEENAPDSEKNKAIPLPDKPDENKNLPEQNKPIPLGYTQDTNNNKNDRQQSPEKSGTGEQTKL